ncbi:unnamed protein product [Fusarium graminearum]|nr:unnamed protein product [Fusarium graminearum]
MSIANLAERLEFLDRSSNSSSQWWRNVNLDDFSSSARTCVGHPKRNFANTTINLHGQILEREAGVRQAVSESIERLVVKLLVVPISYVYVFTVKDATCLAAVVEVCRVVLNATGYRQG